jgi:hypothetical protein
MQHRQIFDVAAAQTALIEPDHEMIHKSLVDH